MLLFTSFASYLKERVSNFSLKKKGIISFSQKFKYTFFKFVFLSKLKHNLNIFLIATNIQDVTSENGKRDRLVAWMLCSSQLMLARRATACTFSQTHTR